MLRGESDLHRGWEEVAVGTECGGRSRSCPGGHSLDAQPQEACLSQTHLQAIKAFDGRGCEEKQLRSV